MNQKVYQRMSEKILSLENLQKDLADFFKTDSFTLNPIEGGASVRKYFILHFNDHRHAQTRVAGNPDGPA